MGKTSVKIQILFLYIQKWVHSTLQFILNIYISFKVFANLYQEYIYIYIYIYSGFVKSMVLKLLFNKTNQHQEHLLLLQSDCYLFLVYC